jgi:hypothetical protein
MFVIGRDWNYEWSMNTHSRLILHRPLLLVLETGNLDL